VAKYETMKVPLRHQNLLRSGHVLATVIDPPAEVIYDYETLCLNLGTCRTNGGQLILNADAFAVHLTNMTHPRIDDALERIGVKIDWDVFGKDAGMQQVTGKDGREATKETKEWLKEFIKKRNRIAHTGIGGIKITESDVTAAIAFFGAFAPVLAAAVEDAVKKSIKREPPVSKNRKSRRCKRTKQSRGPRDFPTNPWGGFVRQARAASGHPQQEAAQPFLLSLQESKPFPREQESQLDKAWWHGSTLKGK
jgi:hypothetical protein